MSSKIKSITLFLAICFITIGAEARDSEESFFMLREAVMESNGDYNKHKKKLNHEEFDRADEWSARDTQAIQIDGKNQSSQDISEFKELKEDLRNSDREVSSHLPSKIEELED